MTQSPSDPLSRISFARRHDGSSGKLKSMMVGCPAALRRLDHGRRAGEIAGEGLLDEDGLAESERAARHLGLEIGGTATATASTARSSISARIAEPARDISGAGESAVRAPSLPASATTAQRGSVRNAGSSTVRP